MNNKLKTIEFEIDDKEPTNIKKVSISLRKDQQGNIWLDMKYGDAKISPIVVTPGVRPEITKATVDYDMATKVFNIDLDDFNRPIITDCLFLGQG